MISNVLFLVSENASEQNEEGKWEGMDVLNVNVSP